MTLLWIFSKIALRPCVSQNVNQNVLKSKTLCANKCQLILTQFYSIISTDRQIMILNTISSKDLLIDAYKFYSRGDARAHDALRIIIDRNDMASAVLGCLAEAKREEDPSKQNLHVQAAYFGKKFHPGIAIEEFESTCRLLRVMNICRSQGLDYTDNLEYVIDQLVRRRQFSLAQWIIRWLKIDGEKKVLEEWTEYIIRKSYLRDEAVAQKIQQALGPEPIITYADIASKAILFNRANLAIKLLENEDRSIKKIPLLMNLKQYDLMLSQALATCNSNLIYMAIFGLKDSMPSERQFLAMLKKHKLAYRYYLNFLSHADIEKLILILHQDGESKDESFYNAIRNASS